MTKHPNVGRISLKADQRAYLVEIAQSSNVISSIENHIDSRYKRYNRISFPIGLLYPFAVGVIIGYLRTHVSGYAAVFVGIGTYTVAFFLIYWIARSFPEVATFRLLVRCMSSIDSALGNPPASKPRKAAARNLARCARAMNRYRPLIPLSSYKRILAQEATRASQALRAFAKPILLGTDEDLKQVKEALARATIRVGTSYWMQVGDLEDSSINGSVQRRAAFSSLLPLLTGVVVPLVAALITLITALLTRGR
jgi:hypothetical protein